MSSASALSCPASDATQFTSGGSLFNIHCGVNYYGGDIARVYTNTFEECVSRCSSTSGCVDVAYISANKKCFMKNSLTEGRENPNVWSAVLAEIEATAGLPSCANNRDHETVYTLMSGHRYSIFCGYDSTYNDISRSVVSNFKQCMELCDTTSGCVAAAYKNTKYCYLKNKLKTKAQRNTAIWLAVREFPTTTTQDCLGPTLTACQGQVCAADGDCCYGAYCASAASGFAPTCLQTKTHCPSTVATPTSVSATATPI